MTSATQLQSATSAKRILVVEDELMIRMLLEDMLGELGYTVAAEAARIEEALEAAKNADFDIAILDVNLNGQPISPVADALVARGMPFVFATGLRRTRPSRTVPRPPDPQEAVPDGRDSSKCCNRAGPREELARAKCAMALRPTHSIEQFSELGHERLVGHVQS
jgi:CheY-like chemotaxis protein